jgi:hypothetical protein
MDSNNLESTNKTADLFILESDKLKDTLNQFFMDSEKLSISEIIELYYQVINILALVKFIRSNFEQKGSTEENKLFLIRVQEIKKLIDKKFDKDLHPIIISYLKKEIEGITKKLKETTPKNRDKTKEGLEIQAKMYEKLRQVMSTKEFVEQYQQGLNNSAASLYK